MTTLGLRYTRQHTEAEVRAAIADSDKTVFEGMVKEYANVNIRLPAAGAVKALADGLKGGKRGYDGTDESCSLARRIILDPRYEQETMEILYKCNNYINVTEHDDLLRSATSMVVHNIKCIRNTITRQMAISWVGHIYNHAHGEEAVVCQALIERGVVDALLAQPVDTPHQRGSLARAFDLLMQHGNTANIHKLQKKGMLHIMSIICKTKPQCLSALSCLRSLLDVKDAVTWGYVLGVLMEILKDADTRPDVVHHVYFILQYLVNNANADQVAIMLSRGLVQAMQRRLPVEVKDIEPIYESDTDEDDYHDMGGFYDGPTEFNALLTSLVHKGHVSLEALRTDLIKPLLQMVSCNASDADARGRFLYRDEDERVGKHTKRGGSRVLESDADRAVRGLRDIIDSLTHFGSWSYDQGTPLLRDASAILVERVRTSKGERQGEALEACFKLLRPDSGVWHSVIEDGFMSTDFLGDITMLVRNNSNVKVAIQCMGALSRMGALDPYVNELMLIFTNVLEKPPIEVGDSGNAFFLLAHAVNSEGTQSAFHQVGGVRCLLTELVAMSQISKRFNDYLRAMCNIVDSNPDMQHYMIEAGLLDALVVTWERYRNDGMDLRCIENVVLQFGMDEDDQEAILSLVRAKAIPCLMHLSRLDARAHPLCSALKNLAKLPEAHEALLTAGAETLLRKYASEPNHAKYADKAKTALAALGLPA